MKNEVIKVQVLTPAAEVYTSEAYMVELVGAKGCLAIGPGHTAIASSMQSGVLRLYDATGGVSEGATRFVSNGSFTIVDNVLTVLAEVVESKAEIDPERAKRAEKRAEKRLSPNTAETAAENVSPERALASLMRAKERLRFVRS